MIVEARACNAIIKLLWVVISAFLDTEVVNPEISWMLLSKKTSFLINFIHIA